jgi:hypothetical protein
MFTSLVFFVYWWNIKNKIFKNASVKGRFFVNLNAVGAFIAPF